MNAPPPRGRGFRRGTKMKRRRETAKDEVPVAPIVLIQIIQVEWSKAARGGAAATARNNVPEALPLPHTAMLAMREPAFVEHFVRYGRRNQFQAPLVDKLLTQPVAEPFADIHRGLAVSLDDDGHAHVALTRYPGAPRRPLRFEGFTLAPGEWGRIRVNGRWTDVDFGWWVYTKLAMNIGLFVRPPRNVFRMMSPAKSYTSLEDLY